MRTLCLTEHVPRESKHLYPEESAKGEDLSVLESKFASFVAEARRIANEESSSSSTSAQRHDRQPPPLTILVGCELEWIGSDPGFTFEKSQLKSIIAGGQLDMFIGSVHHVRQIPIDFDPATYAKACSTVNTAYGLDEAALPEEEKHHKIFAEYFTAQGDMLRATKPPVVGHFDLIRLFASPMLRDPDEYGPGPKTQTEIIVTSLETRWPDVWAKVEENLKFIASYGGVLELNSSALRKGSSQPYPQSEICQAWRGIGGKFVLSDDSHGTAQLATHYPALVRFIENEGLTNDIVAMAKRDGRVVLDPVDFNDLAEWVRIEC